MESPLEALLIIIVVLLGAYWYNAMQAHEQAMRAARNGCERYALQLLDESVAMERLRLKRDGSGRIRFQRRYRFEFLGADDGRSSGWVELLGLRVVAVQLQQAEGMMHELH